MCTDDRFIDALTESAVRTGIDIDTALLCLFDTRPERRDACEARLLEAFDRMHPVIAEELEPEVEELISRLSAITDEAELDAEFERLTEEELGIIDAYLTALDENESVSEGTRVFDSMDDWKNFIVEEHGKGVTFRRAISGNALGDLYAFDANGRRLGHHWDGTQGHLSETAAGDTLVDRGSESAEPSMALSWQPKSVKKTLRDILRSSFVPGSQGDRMFAALHRVELTPDANGNDDAVFTGSNVAQYSRSPRYGYRQGEDAQKYDLKEKSPILDDASVAHVQMQESCSPWGVKVLSGLRRGFVG
jgi:hypothetical protein